MTDYTKYLPPVSGKRGREIIEGWKKQGIKYCPGKHSPILMDDRHRGSFALSWFDHQGVMIMPDGERRPFVEPYLDLGPKEIEELNQFCKERNLRFSVSTDSPWFPGNTIMVIFQEKKV